MRADCDSSPGFLDLLSAVFSVSRLAADLGISPATLAVAWAAAHWARPTPIISATSIEQLQPSLAALDFDMTPDLYARLAALTPTPPPATDRLEEQDLPGKGA